MTDSSEGWQSRRRVLKTVGAAALAPAIAGCSDSGSGGNGNGNGDTGGGNGGTDGAGTGDGGGSSDPLENVQDPENCSSSYDDENPECAEFGNALQSLAQFDAGQTASIIDFAYPCGWGSIDVNTDFDRKFSLMNVGTALEDPDSDDRIYLDMQIRTHYEPVEQDRIQQQLGETNWTDWEYQYDGETRTMAYVDQSNKEYGASAKLTIPHPNTGDLILLEFFGTLHGGACHDQSLELVKTIVKSMEPNADTTHSPHEVTATPQ